MSYPAQARARADALYAGVVTPHRSCGIAIAETFGVPSASYQALRKGGITGEGPCGAIAAGVLVLGELLGDPDPSGPPTVLLRAAIPRFRVLLSTKIDAEVNTTCNARVAHHVDFMGPVRRGYCTNLAALVAETVAEVLDELGVPRALPPVSWENPKGQPR